MNVLSSYKSNIGGTIPIQCIIGFDHQVSLWLYKKVVLRHLIYVFKLRNGLSAKPKVENKGVGNE
jgi:hypothetical protein